MEDRAFGIGLSRDAEGRLEIVERFGEGSFHDLSYFTGVLSFTVQRVTRSKCVGNCRIDSMIASACCSVADAMGERIR